MIDLADLAFLIAVAACVLPAAIAAVASIQWRRSPTEQMLRKHFGGV